MLLTQFDPPGNVPDLAPGSVERQAWSDFISGSLDGNISSVEGTIGAGNCQLYNPTLVDTTEPTAELTVTWNGFPMRSVRAHRDNRVDAWREADDFRLGIARRQDEYLEWFVYKAAGKITRVDFTCEAWDYWNFLGQHAPAQVLALYQTHINPAITNADLFPGGTYNRLNKWNTELGAMHLSHGANTLGAEINLVAFATILWENGGRLVTDPLQTVRCGGFGDEIRSSDPRIGWDINNLARLGFAITLKNPIGLLIESFDDTGFLKPDGSPVGDYWRVLRGFAGGAVRATYEVPAAEGFVVGDITIGGQKIEYGGQLAEHVTMKVVGVACRPGSFSNTPQSCAVPGPAFSRMAARGTPLRYTRMGAPED